ncbi:unnamed protein product, partial [Iphiclides podalirius]
MLFVTAGLSDYTPIVFRGRCQDPAERAELAKVSDSFKWAAFVRERLIVRDRLRGISVGLSRNSRQT